MAKCGCGNSCACTLTEGDYIRISGGGSSNDPYIISADPSILEAFNGVTDVNGITGPSVQLGPEDVGALAPLVLVTARTSTGSALSPNTIVPVNASAAAFTLNLATLVNDDTVKARRIIITKDPQLDSTRNVVTVKTAVGQTFTSGATQALLELPGSWMELQAVKVGSVLSWKIVRTGISKTGADLIYANADQTPTLEEVERSVNFTIGTAAQTEPLGAENFDHRVGGVNVQFNTSLATNDTNYWTVSLVRYRGTETPVVLATKTTKATGSPTAGTAVVAYQPWQFDNVDWNEPVRHLRRTDGLAITFTPTGTPAALGKAVATVRYEPNVIPPVRDSFNRNNSTNNLGPLDSGGAWLVHVGTFGIISAAAYISAHGNDGVVTNRAFASTPVPNANGSASLKLLGSTVGGLCMRMSKNANGTTNGFFHTNTGLWRVDNSNVTQIGTLSTSLATGDTVTWKVSGDIHTIYKNGVQVLQVTDAAYNSTARVGIRVSTDSAVGLPINDDLAWVA